MFPVWPDVGFDPRVAGPDIGRLRMGEIRPASPSDSRRALAAAKPGLSQILQLKGVERAMREAKDRRALSLEHRTWHLESRRIQGEARVQRLDECLLQRPEPLEQRRLGLSGHPRQDAPFPATVLAISGAVEVPAGGADLHVHLESGPGPGRESDRAVLAAVAHVEVGVRGDPARPGERLAVLKLAERQVLVRAPQSFAEVDAERRPAQRELTSGALDPELQRARSSESSRENARCSVAGWGRWSTCRMSEPGPSLQGLHQTGAPNLYRTEASRGATRTWRR